MLQRAFETGQPLATVLPDSLKSWEVLLATHGTRKGHLVCYRPCADNGSIVRMLITVPSPCRFRPSFGHQVHQASTNNSS